MVNYYAFLLDSFVFWVFNKQLRLKVMCSIIWGPRWGLYGPYIFTVKCYTDGIFTVNCYIWNHRPKLSD